MRLSATNDISAFVRKLEASVQATVKSNELADLGNEAIRLIVKRTRLGYGVRGQGFDRYKLPPLSAFYVKQRQLDGSDLSGDTSPTRSNLTRTGQMLDSMAVISVKPGAVVVGPQGGRLDGPLGNDDVARWVSVRRPFNYLSRLEQEQLRRFYRNRFGDLLRNQRLT